MITAHMIVGKEKVSLSPLFKEAYSRGCIVAAEGLIPLVGGMEVNSIQVGPPAPHPLTQEATQIGFPRFNLIRQVTPQGDYAGLVLEMQQSPTSVTIRLTAHQEAPKAFEALISRLPRRSTT
jgi:hypothetical protein